MLGLVGLAAGVWVIGRIRRRARHATKGRVVLITGGSRGLGLELARQLGADGARVAICGRDPDTLERAVADLDRRSVRALAVSCDVTRPSEVAAMLDGIRTLWGPVDVLINNAGRIDVGPALHMTAADHEAALDLHYRAPLRLIEEVLPDMMRRGRGHVVNISSIGGRMAVPHMLPYTASKHALTGLSRALRVELARHGVTVTTVFPGLVRTGSPPRARFKGRNRQEYTWFELSDALPGLSVPVERAARRIVRAIRRGEHEVVVGLPARLALGIHDRVPGAAYALWAVVDRWVLPREGGIGARSATGAESRDGPILGLERRAEARQNQVLEER